MLSLKRIFPVPFPPGAVLCLFPYSNPFSHLVAAPTDVPSRTMSPLSVTAAAVVTEEAEAHDGDLPASFSAAAPSEHLMMQGGASGTAAALAPDAPLQVKPFSPPLPAF